MQGAKYGFVFDSTLNDFISGEMEHAVVTCYHEAKPDIIFIEGQSSLRNPSGPAGSEWIVSAAADAVVLQHNPARKQYKDMEFYPAYLPALKDEIALIKIFGAPTAAVTVNTAKMTPQEAHAAVQQYEKELGIPVVLPLEEGVDRLSLPSLIQGLGRTPGGAVNAAGRRSCSPTLPRRRPAPRRQPLPPARRPGAWRP